MDLVDDVKLLEEPELVAIGVGETIDGGEVEPDDDGVVVLVAVVAVEEEDEDEELLDFVDAGLELSFGTPLANGSRAIRASTTLTGSAEAVVAVVVV